MAARSYGGMFGVHIDATDFEDLGKQYRAAPQKVQRGILSGINKVGDQAMTQVRKDLRAKTGITDKDTRRSKGLFKKLAKEGSPDFAIVARSPWTPLSYFAPSQRNAGVMARPWANPQFFRGAFIATMPSGYRGVFVRVMEDEEGKPVRERKMYRNSITGRLQGGHAKIRALWGPSLAVEMTREPIPQNFQRKVNEIAPRVVNHEVQRVLGALKPKRTR